jgi:hypothetical protein
LFESSSQPFAIIMKANLRGNQKKSGRAGVSFANQRAYWAAIGLVSLACGSSGLAQSANSATNSAPATSGSTNNVTQLEEVNVFGKLDRARENISPDLGASSYTITYDQIRQIPAGANTPFNQVLLRAPGVTQDSFGQIHVRNEHAFVQYRINDVILPEGITGFGTELDTRFVNTIDLITGTLPAQYEERRFHPGWRCEPLRRQLRHHPPEF